MRILEAFIQVVTMEIKPLHIVILIVSIATVYLQERATVQGKLRSYFLLQQYKPI